jgi:hypothetical protein
MEWQLHDCSLFTRSQPRAAGGATPFPLQSQFLGLESGNRRPRRTWILPALLALVLVFSARGFPEDGGAPAGLTRTARVLDGITATRDEDGRTVYVNASPSRSAAAALPGRGQGTRRHSVLVYWSNQEGRWKPVPPPSPSALRGARRAAIEVEERIRRDCGKPDSGCSPAPSPQNYTPSATVEAAIAAAAARHGVDPDLVRAVIKVESNFNPQAVSPKGAMGLMQLMPETARRLSVDHPFDPQENVDAGVRHLRTLLDDFGGDVRRSLAAYNAGETAVLRAGDVPDYAETRNYVKQITSMYGGDSPAPGGSRSSPIRMSRGADGVLRITNE